MTSSILELSDLQADKQYYMYPVHFQLGTLGIPRKVVYSKQSDRPVLKIDDETVLLRNINENIQDEDDEATWVMLTQGNGYRTMKFSQRQLNLHKRLVNVCMLQKGCHYNMFLLKYDHLWNKHYKRVKFRGWTPFFEAVEMSPDGFPYQVETCVPLLLDTQTGKNFALKFDAEKGIWSTKAGELVLFDSQQHTTSDSYMEQLYSYIITYEGLNDVPATCPKITLAEVPLGFDALDVHANIYDPIRMSKPRLSRAVYLDSDLSENQEVKTVYYLSTLVDLLERNITCSPMTRRQFSAKNIKRVSRIRCGSTLLKV